jgi:hypothetical protein
LSTFVLQVLVPAVVMRQWASVHPVGGEPYKFDSRDEAERMARVCYPELVSFKPDEIRVMDTEELTALEDT